MAIDYGMKRVGLAVTDPHRMIATPLATVNTKTCCSFLKEYMQHEVVDVFVVGLPKDLSNRPTPMTEVALKFIKLLRKTFPEQHTIPHDERYTSKIAAASLVEGGFKRKERRNKANLDRLSATLILQSFLMTHSSRTSL